MLRGQFTYTASEVPGAYETRSGWKVQAVTSPPGTVPPPEDLVRAAARNVGAFRPAVVPELATRADVEALPRCLRLDVLAPDLVCLSHLAPAGPDYSGRPNFFAHSLLVAPDGEDMDDVGHLRPADLWDAPLWLRPVGARAVADSRLDDVLSELTRGGPQVDPPAAHRHLLVSALHRALRDGAGAVVLVGDDPAAVVRWVGLVGRLLLPAVAWRVPFSTYERIADADAVSMLPFRLLGVPLSDADHLRRLPGDRYVVLDDRATPTPVGPGAWQLADGTLLRSSRWADLVETLAEDGALSDVLDTLGELAFEVGHSTDDRPEWALAAAALLAGIGPGPAAAAADLAVEHWPAGLAAGPATLARLLGGLDAALGTRDAVLARLLPVAGPAVVQLLVSDSLAASDSGAAPLGAAGTYRLVAGLPAGDDDLGRRAASALVVRIFDDPASVRSWPPPPAWLQPYVLDHLSQELAVVPALPGRKLTADAWAWLGRADPVRGELTTEALAALGPLDLEQAARDVLWSSAVRHHSPLARGAAFMAFMASDAMLEGRPLETLCRLARDDAWRGQRMLLPDVVALLPVVPEPMAALVAELLRDVAPTTATREAARLVLDHDDIAPGDRDAATLQRHLSGIRAPRPDPGPVPRPDDQEPAAPDQPVRRRPSPIPLAPAADRGVAGAGVGDFLGVEPDEVALRAHLIDSLRSTPRTRVVFTRVPQDDEWDAAWLGLLDVLGRSAAVSLYDHIARLVVRGALCEAGSGDRDPAHSWLLDRTDPGAPARYVRCGMELAELNTAVDGYRVKEAVAETIEGRRQLPDLPPGAWESIATEAARMVAQSVWDRLRAQLGLNDDVPTLKRSRQLPRFLGGSPGR